MITRRSVLSLPLLGLVAPILKWLPGVPNVNSVSGPEVASRLWRFSTTDPVSVEVWSRSLNEELTHRTLAKTKLADHWAEARDEAVFMGFFGR